ncbi:uncharacterized protein LOC121053317 [Oryza brachyantha]|uniref:uncharacterized protein LOC121053317 n=1 Tax=Oryza brachyantha TaxID=4533 RepID=UPI001ADA3DE1|nr:uncharacterized protein LOC121053317 [Oryza brachyantha]
MQPFSRHAGFFASLKQVEDRLAAEQPPAAAAAAARQPEPPPFSDTMTASPLFLGPATDATAADRPGGESSSPAVDFLTLSKDEEPRGGDDGEDDDGDDESGEDIARLVALLGLSPPPRGGSQGGHNDDGGGCDCSGGDGFLAKVVGVVGPKCDKEKKRVDGWVQHYFSGGECREPARLAHLLLAKASWSWEGEGHRGASPIVFPTTVKEFLDRDAPPRWTEEEQR